MSLFVMNANVVLALIDKEEKDEGIDIENSGCAAHFPGRT
jgi:hypothetical protein